MVSSSDSRINCYIIVIPDDKFQIPQYELGLAIGFHTMPKTSPIVSFYDRSSSMIKNFQPKYSLIDLHILSKIRTKRWCLFMVGTPFTI